MNRSGDLFAGIEELLTMTVASTVREGVVQFEVVGMASRNLSDRTRAEYRRDLDDLATFLESRGLHRLGDVSLNHLEHYQAEMDGRGYAPATRRRKTQSIKAFFGFLDRQAILQTDVAARLPCRASRSASRGSFPSGSTRISYGLARTTRAMRRSWSCSSRQGCASLSWPTRPSPTVSWTAWCTTPTAST
jgi:hypothetical protein